MSYGVCLVQHKLARSVPFCQCEPIGLCATPVALFKLPTCVTAGPDYSATYPAYALESEGNDAELARMIGQAGLLLHYVYTGQHCGGSTGAEREAWVKRVGN